MTGNEVEMKGYFLKLTRNCSFVLVLLGCLVGCLLAGGGWLIGQSGGWWHGQRVGSMISGVIGWWLGLCVEGASLHLYEEEPIGTNSGEEEWGKFREQKWGKFRKKKPYHLVRNSIDLQLIP